jgi:hypothetical protein
MADVTIYEHANFEGLSHYDAVEGGCLIIGRVLSVSRTYHL